MNVVLLVLAVLFSAVAAILGFGWFGTNATVPQILGVVAAGLTFGWAALLVGTLPWPTRS